MKIKFGEQEIEIIRMFDTAEKREGCVRQIVVTVDGSGNTTDGLYAALDTSYTGSFVLVKEDGTTETFSDFPEFTISRNIEKNTEQTTICFGK